MFGARWHCRAWRQQGRGRWRQRTGSRAVRPIAERAVALLDAREAPTQAQVSSTDASASAGFAPATAPGKYVLHVRPARQQRLHRLRDSTCHGLTCPASRASRILLH